MSLDDFETFADELSELFDASVEIERCVRREMGGTTIAIVDIRVSRTAQGTDSSPTTIRTRQTAVVLSEPTLDLPKFDLSPATSGLMGKMVGWFGDIGYLKFDDSPDFMSHYRLHAWSEAPTRILFTPAIREHFSLSPGWGLRGSANRLVVFRPNQLVAEDQQDEFVHEALLILSLLQEGEEELDQHPEVRRETTPADVAATADRMTGVVGEMYRRQLRAIRCTTEELETWLQSATPRKIPAGIRTQVIGNNMIMVIMGFVFGLVGLTAGGLTILWAKHDQDKMVGALLLIVFLVAGCLMSFVTLYHRRRKTRLLCDGELIHGNILRIDEPPDRGSQSYHEVRLEYVIEGETRQRNESVMGIVAERAKKMRAAGEKVRILVDPEDHRHIVCADLLVIFD
ncbi:DUF3592 domain-containing protein [Novipirellula artificiosorum]|uniref:Uncharacterized protein n=1 Tax=Novipirellula artificiosorum TaxID=2528016 RepID=A0A5C6DKQ3_9BACT|nr:DUF3592 domain-containing protein [Novipirellula artificiosorum]TWU37348.1 hypothetical protein Poly41_34780 [Novipirellula artificiosorum]